MHAIHDQFRSLCRVALAVLCLAAIVVLPSAAAAARGRTTNRATAAAGWLGRQFLSGGDLPRTAGEPGVDYLPLAIVALDSARVGGPEIRRGIAYLKKDFESFVEVRQSATRSVTDPGRLAEVILAAVVAKTDPWHFGGRKGANDLVARLLATQVRTGADKGLFGSPKGPLYSSAYSQGLSLAALAAVRRVNAEGARWLVSQQCSDGGWESYRSGSACPPPDPKTYSGPDTNDTALAVEGLVASKVVPKVSPLGFFRTSQYQGGAFGYYGGHSSAQAPDPDSTAVVAQALAALRKVSAVTRRGRNVEEGLAAFELTCSSPRSERGSLRYPGEKGPNLLATIQAVPALLRQAYPVPGRRAPDTLPVMSCA